MFFSNFRKLQKKLPIFKQKYQNPQRSSRCRFDRRKKVKSNSTIFLVPQKFQLENVKKLDAEMTYVLNREAAQKSAAIEVDRDRLVKRGESPTDKVHCHTGSLETLVGLLVAVYVVHCHTGSLEKI